MQADAKRPICLCNLLSIKYLQRGCGSLGGLRATRGCDPEKFFCIFFRMSELHHFGLILKKGENGHFWYEKM